MKQKEVPGIMKNSQSIMKISNKDKGVLLLHGFLGSPYEMKYLGQKIFDQGYSISIPRLPGHGTQIEEITRVTDKDWITCTREAFIELKSHCKDIYIVGLSMGGLLGLLIAKEFTLSKIALISVPCSIKKKSIYLTPIVGKFKKIHWQLDTTKGLASEEARNIHESYYTGIPINQVWCLFRLIKKGMKSIPKINSRFFIMQSKQDEAIPKNSIDYIYNLIKTNKKEKFILEKSNHAITVDLEKDIVAEKIISFLDN